MRPSEHEDFEDDPEQLNLGAMIGIALAAIVGTTLTVWMFHFMHIGTVAAVATKPFPRIAMLPFHCVSASPEDAELERKLTNAVMTGLISVARVEALPSAMDADPVAVGQELGVRMLIVGKIERRGSGLDVIVKLVSASDGNQVWIGSFRGNSDGLNDLSTRINKALAPHLTALLD